MLFIAEKRALKKKEKSFKDEILHAHFVSVETVSYTHLRAHET